jgi:hypothetical protein
VKVWIGHGVEALEADMKTAALLALAAVAAPAVAAAEAVPYGYYSEPPPSAPRDPWTKPRFEGAVGALVGGYSVGPVSGTAGGMHFDAGLRMDKLYLYGEYDFLSVGQDSYEVIDPVRGFLHRLGANARYSLAAFGGHGEIPVRGDVWAEVGAGHEMIWWHEGGKLTRRDLSFGFGAQATFRIGRDKPKFIGVYYAFKGWVADAPGSKGDMDPTCAGPCDEPTGPSPYDFGLMFNFGVPFGR